MADAMRWACCWYMLEQAMPLAGKAGGEGGQGGGGSPASSGLLPALMRQESQLPASSESQLPAPPG